MTKLIMGGNGPLSGRIRISGAKNAALPCLTACILSSEPVTLHNMPQVDDIQTMCTLLRELGMDVEREGDRITVDGGPISSHRTRYDLVKAMRASILALGPLLARLGQAEISMPGGCAIGARPVDLHIAALKNLGAEVTLDHGDIDARAKRLHGAQVIFDKVTVTGTENIMMAATLAEGPTTIRNAAQEPEVVDLADLLRAMGAKIQGDGTSTILVEGVERLHSATHHVIPDRIETGTYVCAAAITAGQLDIDHCNPKHLTRFLQQMQQTGLEFDVAEQTISVKPHRGLAAIDVQTQPHPGFPTDMQAQYMAVMTQAQGRSLITESIFENRFMHAVEMKRMGADIRIDGHTAIVSGPSRLSGAQVQATDLRASASLVLAGLIADGETQIHDIHHLDRGYDRLDEKLVSAGARIQRCEI